MKKRNRPGNREGENLIKKAVQEEMESLEKQPSPESWEAVASRLHKCGDESNEPVPASAPEESRTVRQRRWWGWVSAAAAVLLLLAGSVYYGMGFPAVDQAVEEESGDTDSEDQVEIAGLDEDSDYCGEEFEEATPAEEGEKEEYDLPQPEEGEEEGMPEEDAPRGLGVEDVEEETEEDTEEDMEDEYRDEDLREAERDTEEGEGTLPQLRSGETEDTEYGEPVPSSMIQYSYRETLEPSVPERLYLLYVSWDEEEVVYVKLRDEIPAERLPYLIEEDWAGEEIDSEETGLSLEKLDENEVRSYKDNAGRPLRVWEKDGKSSALWAFSETVDSCKLKELQRELEAQDR